MLGLVLHPGSIEVGLRRSEMKRFTYDAGELRLTPRIEKWFRIDDLHFLSITISDTALAAACEGTNGEVELRGADTVLDARVSALANCESSNMSTVKGKPRHQHERSLRISQRNWRPCGIVRTLIFV